MGKKFEFTVRHFGRGKPLEHGNVWKELRIAGVKDDSNHAFVLFADGKPISAVVFNNRNNIDYLCSASARAHERTAFRRLAGHSPASEVMRHLYQATRGNQYQTQQLTPEATTHVQFVQAHLAQYGESLTVLNKGPDRTLITLSAGAKKLLKPFTKLS